MKQGIDSGCRLPLCLNSHHSGQLAEAIVRDCGGALSQTRFADLEEMNAGSRAGLSLKRWAGRKCALPHLQKSPFLVDGMESALDWERGRVKFPSGFGDFRAPLASAWFRVALPSLTQGGGRGTKYCLQR